MSATLSLNEKVLTHSETEKQSFTVSKHRSESLSFRISPRLCLVLRELLKKFDQNFKL